MAKKPSTNIDFHWHKRAQNSIAHASLTNSKRPESFVKGVYPTHLSRSKGCYVWDTQNRKYIDFICGLGTNLLGYGNDEIAKVISDQAYNGISPSLATDIEVKAAEKVKEMFPFIQKLRFLKTGSDACSAALRIARAFSKKDDVMSEGYHGWHDEFASLMPPAIGVPFMANDAICSKSKLENPIRDGIKILEPVELDYSADRLTYLKYQREKQGPLIFDEIITGFRYKSHSVSKHHDITPDLICLGKAIANGLPLSVVGGSSSIMECDEYFVSSTFAGETLSLVAAIKNMQLLQTKYDINDLWEVGQRFMDEFNSMCPQVQLKGYATRGRFEGDELTKALFFQESVKAGVLFGPSWFICFPHITLMDEVLKICENVFMKIKSGMAKLEGEMPKSPFAERMRNAASR
jgi:glutamate-1-semialdehyde aminotransferase